MHVAYLLKGPHSLKSILFSATMDVFENESRDESELELSSELRLLLNSPNLSLLRLEAPWSHAFAVGRTSSKSGGKETWRGNMQQWLPRLERLHILFEVAKDEDLDVPTFIRQQAD